jgi:hypothetical protein
MTDAAVDSPEAGGPVAPPAVFLERQSYRRRRLMDAARMLPAIGAVLFTVPLLWPNPKAGALVDAGIAAVPMSNAIYYVFSVWAILIAVSFLFGLSARHWGQNETPNRKTKTPTTARRRSGRRSGSERENG